MKPQMVGYAIQMLGAFLLMSTWDHTTDTGPAHQVMLLISVFCGVGALGPTRIPWWWGMLQELTLIAGVIPW
jgi:uncharacterized membrane protein